jgi:hypothetical protein
LPDYEEEDFLGKVLPIHVTEAYRLYEAARQNGVKRVIRQLESCDRLTMQLLCT